MVFVFLLVYLCLLSIICGALGLRLTFGKYNRRWIESRKFLYLVHDNLVHLYYSTIVKLD